MKRICPNLSDPAVKAEFDELVAAVGEKQAYTIWDQNNGYNLDKAPNGEPSKLFSDLLEHFNGNRLNALKTKAKMFGNGFKTRFGDWLEPTDQLKQQLDSNGEPLLTKINSQLNDKLLERSKVLRDIGEFTNTKQLIDYILSMPDVSPRIKQLLETLKQKSTQLVIEEYKESEIAASYAGYVKLYAPVILSSTNQKLAEDVAHEMLHHYLSYYYDTNTNFRNYVDSVYNEFKDSIKDEYAATSAEEFLNEFMSNSQTRTKLKLRNKSLFDRIITIIKAVFHKLFGGDFTKLSMPKDLTEFENTIVDVISRVNAGDINTYSVDTYEDKPSAMKIDMESSNADLLGEDYINQTMEKFRLQRNNFDKTLTELRQLITNAVQARIKAIQNRKTPNKTALLVPLEQQLSALKNPNIDTLQTIVYCLTDIKRNMTAPVNAILRAQKNLREGKDSGFSNLALVQLQQDYFGMYNQVLEEIAKKVFDSDLYKELLGEKSFDDMKTMISNMRTQFAAARQGITELTTDLAQKTLLKYGVKDKISRSELEQYVSEDLITTENDISWLSKRIGAGDKMNDKAARVIFDIVANANNKVRFNTHKFGNKLLRLQNEVSLGDQMRLFEYDQNGRKTGYFIRDRKYGQFMNELDAERKRLKTKYQVPKGLDVPINKEARTEFNKEMNKWLGEHCERRYTNKYYDAFNSLSQEARDARDAIQFKIYKLLDDVRDNKGKVHLEDLDAKQWAQLENYNIQKKQLMSLYYEDGTPKTDLDKQIAEELTQLNKTLHEGMRYTVNRQKFEQAKQEAENTLTPEQYEQWKKRYTREQISDKFYEQLAEIEKKEYGKEYTELKKIREELTKPYRNEYTGGYDVKYMSSTLMRTLRSIDREMRRIRKNARKTKARQSKEDATVEGLKFEDIAESVTTEQYKEDKAAAVRRGMEYYEIWEQQHHIIYYVGDQEVKIPNWYYTKIVPKDQTLIDYEAPTREFSEIDPNSEYFNKNFDTNIDEYYQPKKSLYENKEYKQLFNPTIDKDGNEVATKNIPLWNLYKGLLKGMEESNDKLTFLTRNNFYRLPQMSGSMYQYMKSDGLLKGLLTHTKQGIFKETDDVGFVDAPTSRPDGSEQRMIPTYFINKLDNPNNITNDIVGAVISYYKMAENFKQKTEIQPDLEVIKMQLANRTYTGKSIGLDALGKKVYKQSNRKPGKDTNTYQFISKFIDMQEYGEESKSIIRKFGEDSRIAKLLGIVGEEINWSKLIHSIKNYGQLLGLGLNLGVGATGFVTSFLAQLGFVANGRYFDFHSFSRAYFNMLSNLFGIVHYMHGTTTDNKYVALMQRFEVGTEFQNAYKNSNRVGWINTLTRNWAFGLFSFSDFVIKGTILNSIMNNYRYYNGKFYNSQQFNELFNNKENAKNIWRTLQSTYDIINIKDGNIVITDRQQAKAFAEVQNEISNSARTLAATADGQLTEEQKAQFTANAFGGLIMMFRNYIPNIIDERITMKKQYDYDTGMVREALYRTIARVTPMLIRDWSSRKQLGASDIGNIRQFTFEITMISLLLFAVKPLLTQAADDDKNNWAKNFLALLVTRGSFEYSNQYNLLDLLNNITSVSSIFDLISPFTNILSLPQLYDAITDDKVIKYGPYKDDTKLERWLWKMTPLKNIKEIQDPALKRKYYEQLYK